MSSFKSNFRLWWQKPRSVLDRDPERSVTFLELFYDLIFVVIIAELTHVLAEDLTLQAFQEFAFMFIIIWWSWLNGTAYVELHGNDDVRTRVFTFLQIICIAFMAVFAHNALGEGSVGFAIAYSIYQLILTWLWWRTGYHLPEHRPLSNPYSLSFLAIALSFLVSIFVEPPVRFYLWAFGVLFSLILPFALRLFAINNPEAKKELEASQFNTDSAVERFGLFNIIVLGEVIVGVVNGLAYHEHLTDTILKTAILGLIVAFGLWWLYFDSVAHRIPKDNIMFSTSWAFLHLPLGFAIAALGAMISNLVAHAEEITLTSDVAWLIIGTLVLAFASILLLLRTIKVPDTQNQIHRTASIVLFISSTLILIVGFLDLNIINFLLVINILMLAPIFFGIRVWISNMIALNSS